MLCHHHDINYIVTINTIIIPIKLYIDMKKFAGLNFCGFNPSEVVVEILLHFLIQKCLLLKSGTYIHGKAFTVLLKTTKL